ncbi:MAG: ABC transporter ATP-binding protein/permease [Oscillospiraceae bacterium]|jgi:ATP-binding cassette subfamily B protein|nr:ABC transporter ATP-binding protein/permease [Oscillospiraceae bacterium]
MEKKTTKLQMLLDFLRGGKRWFALAVVAMGAATLFRFLTPQVVGYTVDAVIGGKTVELPEPLANLLSSLGGGTYGGALLLCALGVAVTAVLAGAFNYAARMCNAVGSQAFVKRARDILFNHTQRLPFEWHMKHMTGDTIQRCTSDVQTTRGFVADQLIEVVRTVILIATALFIMFSMNVTMALVVSAFIPIILVYTLFFTRRIAGEFLQCDEAEGELMVAVQENLTGVRVVRAFGRERFERDRFDEKNNTLAAKWIRLGYTLGVYWGVGDVVSTLALLAVITVGAYLSAGGSFTLGEFLIFITYTQQLTWPVRQLGRTLSEMSKAGVSIERLHEIIAAPAETSEPNAKTPPLERDIVFDNVSFTYEERPVLQDLSFTVPRGATLGILGATGSGKSTLTYLLNRLYDLPRGSGSITIGGVDLREIDRAYLRRNVGLVLQEPFLFSKTIFENIDIAARTGDRAKVRDKARAAAVDDDIAAFRNGYDTMVGERGVTLSGGQKQRVAIARTLMTEAPIMVFDDSMSALDMETDAKIREALRQNTSGATVILISHRVSTLMTADKIIVLEGGRVTESGTHRDLLEQNGHYKRVYDIQSAAEVQP